MDAHGSWIFWQVVRTVKSLNSETQRDAQRQSCALILVLTWCIDFDIHLQPRNQCPDPPSCALKKVFLEPKILCLFRPQEPKFIRNLRSEEFQCTSPSSALILCWTYVWINSHTESCLGTTSTSFQESGASVFKIRDSWCVDFLSSRRYAASIFVFMATWRTDFLSSPLCNIGFQLCDPDLFSVIRHCNGRPGPYRQNLVGQKLESILRCRPYLVRQ